MTRPRDETAALLASHAVVLTISQNEALLDALGGPPEPDWEAYREALLMCVLFPKGALSDTAIEQIKCLIAAHAKMPETKADKARIAELEAALTGTAKQMAERDEARQAWADAVAGRDYEGGK